MQSCDLSSRSSFPPLSKKHAVRLCGSSHYSAPWTRIVRALSHAMNSWQRWIRQPARYDAQCSTAFPWCGPEIGCSVVCILGNVMGVMYKSRVIVRGGIVQSAISIFAICAEVTGLQCKSNGISLRMQSACCVGVIAMPVLWSPMLILMVMAMWRRWTLWIVWKHSYQVTRMLQKVSGNLLWVIVVKMFVVRTRCQCHILRNASP
mmetsp:Transcript_89289/g.163818  ORF Transcript_89289/g.163818 Transcript_89289/m.163818 type:complete len:205 (-) Transcript_89289:97-711(-)